MLYIKKKKVDVTAGKAVAVIAYWLVYLSMLLVDSGRRRRDKCSYRTFYGVAQRRRSVTIGYHSLTARRFTKQVRIPRCIPIRLPTIANARTLTPPTPHRSWSTPPRLRAIAVIDYFYYCYDDNNNIIAAFAYARCTIANCNYYHCDWPPQLIPLFCDTVYKHYNVVFVGSARNHLYHPPTSRDSTRVPFVEIIVRVRAHHPVTALSVNDLSVKRYHRRRSRRV